MNLDGNDTYCSYCLKHFNLNYIKCNECRNVSLCLMCFGYGVQGGSHKRNHSYSFQMCNLLSKIFTESEWNLDEELKLLRATELYGIGNWNDISGKVESHTADECRDHYTKHYIDGVLGRYLLKDTQGGRRRCKVQDHSVNYGDGGSETSKLSPSLFEVLPQCGLSAEEQLVLGYMPKRDDFERDYDNEAEGILCGLKPDFVRDDLLDALKVAHVGIYTQRLKERQRRKVIAREHGLVSPLMACVLNRRWRQPQSEEGAPEAEGTVAGARSGRPFAILCGNTPQKGKGRPPKVAAAGRASPRKGAVATDDGGRWRPYDAFMISDSLKPFLRYLTFTQGKALLENLHREEVLKYEISTIIEALRRGRRRILDAPFRYPAFSGVFVRTRPRLATAPVPSVENGCSVPADSEGEDVPEPPRLCHGPSVPAPAAKKGRKRRRSRSYFFGIKRQR